MSDQDAEIDEILNGRRISQVWGLSAARDPRFDDGKTDFMTAKEHADRIGAPGGALSGVDMSDQDLDLAMLRGEDLTDTKFNRSSMRNAYLDGAGIKDAEFRGTDLAFAQLTRLRETEGADFTGAKLQFADMRYTDFKNADFTHANLENADLFGADLSKAKINIHQVMQARNWQSAILPQDIRDELATRGVETLPPQAAPMLRMQ